MRGKWVRFSLTSLVVILPGLLLAHLPLASGTEPVTLTDYQPTPRPSEGCDLCEPNNLMDQACGPLAPGEGYQYFIRCTSRLDDDFYYVDLEKPGSVIVDLTNIPPGDDYDLYLYDESETLLCYSNKPGNLSEHIACSLSQRGRYYIWVHPYAGCSESDPYTLAVAYPTPAPTPMPTSTPTPLCNLYIDDFGDTNPDNDLGGPSGWALDPPGCGSFDVHYTGFELRLDYDLVSAGECTARYTTTLSLNASPYETLSFEIWSDDQEELTSTAIGLRDEAGREMSVKVGDTLHQVLSGTRQAGNLPLAALATTVDTTQLDSLFVELAEAQGASQGTIKLDRLRLERPHVPLTVDNFNDLTDPNALGGGFGIYMGEDPGTTLETAYITDDTYDDSPGSYIISYTLPSASAWALWETYLLGLDVSDYAFLTFYIRGANGGDKVNLYLEDRSENRAYVDVEVYTPIGRQWSLVRVPLQAFEGIALTDLTKIKLTFEWQPMTGTIYLDDLRFVADRLLVDNFCDSDPNNSLNYEVNTFASPPDQASVGSSLSDGTLALDYDVSGGPAYFSGYYSRVLLDLNPYRTLAVKVRGGRCGEEGAISARTVPVATDKIHLSDYLIEGITDQWQEARIPLAASSVVTDWTRGDSYVIAFEAGWGASQGTTWWDDVAFETACAPLWVDNFNDADDANALVGWPNLISEEAEITSSTAITQAYGDGGAGLVLTYAVPAGKWAGWETDLRDVNLSDYDRLVFTVKGAAGGERPNLYLEDGDGERGLLNIETYTYDRGPLTTAWQTIVIPLEDFGDLDMTRIRKLQFIIEWESADVEGSLSLDNIRFLPSARCIQSTPNLVYLPLVTKGCRPLVLDPIWDFESGTDGWTHQTYWNSQAVIATEAPSHRALWGNGSLALILDLVGSDDNRSQGETFVDMVNSPPPDTSPPLDLTCKPLSCWVYVPTCGLGDPASSNLVQIFVKDVNGKSAYGSPTQVVRNRWFEVRLRPSNLAPDGGYKDPGFDPGAIELFGVRYTAGSEGITYRGKVYVDACGWQEIDPASAAAAETCRLGEGTERIPPPLPHPKE